MQLPDLVYAHASPKSRGGRSLFEKGGEITVANVDDFASERSTYDAAVTALRDAGFQVLTQGHCTINIAAPASTFERVLGARLEAKRKTVVDEFGQEEATTLVRCADTDSALIEIPEGPLKDVLEGVVIETPYSLESVDLFASSPRRGGLYRLLPSSTYWHVRVPGDISLGLNADRAHRDGITGRGIRLVMIDSGFFPHPHYLQRGYRVRVVLGPGTQGTEPNEDAYGHGTAMTANAFAVAPDIDFMMVKTRAANFPAAFQAATMLEPPPDIISCSVRSRHVSEPPIPPELKPLEAALSHAVARGIVVICCAGNNGAYSLLAQHPDVVSVGGVHVRGDGTFRASRYSSGYESKLYRGRIVPDVCGMIGTKKRPEYIMMPVPPAADLGEERGWAAHSGTSAAAPQIAGVCALILQACPDLGRTAGNQSTCERVREILRNTARDVADGESAMGHPARSGRPDLATGWGLVDAYAALNQARRTYPSPTVSTVTVPETGGSPEE